MTIPLNKEVKQMHEKEIGHTGKYVTIILVIYFNKNALNLV